MQDWEMGLKGLTPMKTTLVQDKTLFDGLGNSCRLELHRIGSDSFELYLHDFNGAIPRRVVGALGELNSIAEHWLQAKHSNGFATQFKPPAP